MDDQLDNMVKILEKNKEYGQIAIKAEFEAVLKVRPEDVQKKMDKALGRTATLESTE